MSATNGGAPADVGRILVVDDNELNRDLLSRRLRRQGHTVTVAETGRRALELLAEQPCDLILLDIMMPEMNGYQVLERLRADERWRHVPVVMISAVQELESVVRCIELGADDYLTKPFDPVLLRARIGACLEKKRLRDAERTWAKSLERDLEIGREIQRNFFPEVLPERGGWELAARFRPARQVSGDFYDAFALEESGETAVVIADVCDKGVGAALFMALFRSLIRAIAQSHVAALGELRESRQSVLVTAVSGAAAMRRAVLATNDYIARTHARVNMFATLFFGVLDPESGTLAYINAGHEAPVIVRGGRAERRLPPTGPAVGIMPSARFGVAEVVLEPGDALVAFTDGVTEARAPDGAFYSEERLLARLAEATGGATAMLDAVERDLASFTAGAEPSDDVTMLALRRSVRP